MSSSSSDDKNMKEQQPTVITIRKNKITRDNRSLSSMSVLVEIITTISPDRERIRRKKKKKKFSKISITENKITQEPDNQSKKEKLGSSIDETKINVQLTPPPKTNKQEYAGGTKDKTCDSQTREAGDSSSETDICARNIDEEHKNEEDDDYMNSPSLKKT